MLKHAWRPCLALPSRSASACLCRCQQNINKQPTDYTGNPQLYDYVLQHTREPPVRGCAHGYRYAAVLTLGLT